ncbi:DASS family sodium-coupled anion symporter [Halostella sp. JP-L12]|uniref:SLC13 family permease n=1 Tax=Halostella TaxID=1843185 RepID=UPI000EF85325|nr:MULTISPECIES: DASS family sodium-coupled anion symporter [Halostella]NHN49238.1 DASS family sodium-coupled anion symporter [Halostella sp. JP-L12]
MVSGRSRLFLVSALIAMGLVILLPLPGLSQAGTFALATMVFAAVLWVTEGLPLPATALCVPILLTLFGVFPTMAGALQAFADPIIFLLLAGFVLAEALKKHGIDRRIAYYLIGGLGTSARGIVFAVMAATALLSMIVSNSATTAMMVPIALGIARELTETQAESPASTSNIEIALLLGTAYAASIGGVGTLIGTPANAIVVAQLQTQLDHHISFLDWLAIGLPLVAVGLPVAWYLLVYRLFPPATVDVEQAQSHAAGALDELGSLNSAGRRTVGITSATAGLWVLGGLDFLFEDILPPAWYSTIFGGAGSIIGATHQGVLYYVLVGLAAVPMLLAADALEWDDVLRIDWGTLVLLGGGLALADGLAATDATQWLAELTFGGLTGVSVLVLILVVISVTVFLSELASNTAVVAIFAPILITIGPRYATVLNTTDEGAAVFLAVAGAVAASFGFALPVATPPNAIAFGTGTIHREHMLHAGVRLDILMILLSAVVLLGGFVLL